MCAIPERLIRDVLCLGAIQKSITFYLYHSPATVTGRALSLTNTSLFPIEMVAQFI